MAPRAGAGGRPAPASKGAGGAAASSAPPNRRELQALLDIGPGAWGWADQGWTLPRIAEVVHTRFGVDYTLAGRGPAAAPPRLERAGPCPPRRRAQRGTDRRLTEGDLADDKTAAADLGAWPVFEDESGQGLRPPKGRTWGRRGCTPVVRVTAQNSPRLSLAALLATKPGHRPRLIYRTHPGRRRRPADARA
jgi:hypothetical protein